MGLRKRPETPSKEGRAREALRCSDKVEDIDDHISHYEALVRKCDAVLQKTTAGRVPVSR